MWSSFNNQGSKDKYREPRTNNFLKSWSVNDLFAKSKEFKEENSKINNKSHSNLFESRGKRRESPLSSNSDDSRNILAEYGIILSSTPFASSKIEAEIIVSIKPILEENGILEQSRFIKNLIEELRGNREFAKELMLNNSIQKYPQPRPTDPNKEAQDIKNQLGMCDDTIKTLDKFLLKPPLDKFKEMEDGVKQVIANIFNNALAEIIRGEKSKARVAATAIQGAAGGDDNEIQEVFEEVITGVSNDENDGASSPKINSTNFAGFSRIYDEVGEASPPTITRSIGCFCFGRSNSKIFTTP